MIGAAILGMNAKCKDPIVISRSKHLCADTGANEINGSRFKTEQVGTIRHLGQIENNEITGKRTRDTIRVRSTEPLYAAVPQENAEEDLIHYDGAEWRVISVIKNASTWRALAVRTGGKKEFCEDEANPSLEQSSIHFIR